MNAEIIYNMDIEEYHKYPALGSSSMKILLKSAKKFEYQYIKGNAQKKEQTAALKFGSQYDCLVLEPHKYNDLYEIKKEFNIPKQPLLKDVGREIYEEYKKIIESSKTEKENYEKSFFESGKIIVTQEDHDTASEMLNELMLNSASWIIEKGEKQVSIFWTDKRTGVRCKCRPDIMLKPGDSEFFPHGVILDLKSAKDGSQEGFGKDLFSFGYDLSAAHYLDGFKAAFEIDENENVPWYWVISEKEPPYEAVYRPILLDQLIHGKYHADKALEIYANAVKTNEWIGYSKTPEPAITPGWIQKKIDMIINGDM